MKKIIYTLIVIALSACSSVTKEKLGITKKAPDEYMVVPKAPLSLPPEYNFVPVKATKSVKPVVRLDNITQAEAVFVSKFNASPKEKINAISSEIDRELQRFGNNG